MNRDDQFSNINDQYSKTYINHLSFKERIQKFVTHHREVKHPIVVWIATLLMIVILIVSGFVRSDLNGAETSVSRPDGTAVQMTFTGDVMLGRFIGVKGEKQGYDSLFKNVSYLWEDSNIVMGNLDGVALSKPTGEYKRSGSDSLFGSTPEKVLLSTNSDAVKALKKSGFTLVGLANDNLADYGKTGMKSTFRILKNNKLSYVGAGTNSEQAAKYKVKKINGFKISIIAVTDVVSSRVNAGDNSPGALTTRYAPFYDIVNTASEETDFTVVYIHWGMENILNPTADMTETAYKLIDAGADLVIGTNPHVLLPVEKYRDGIIFYSMGNFIFDQGFERQRDSALLNYTITKDGKGQIELIPIQIVDGSPAVTDSKSAIKRINHFLTKRLSGSDYKITDEGHIIMDAPGVNMDEVAERKAAEKKAAEKEAAEKKKAEEKKAAESTTEPDAEATTK